MELPTDTREFRPLVELASPIECFEGHVTHGTTPGQSKNYKVLFVRDGTAQLHGEDAVQQVSPGDLILVRPGATCGCIAVSKVEVLTAYVNPTFIVDQFRWTLPGNPDDRAGTYREVVRAIPGIRSLRLAPAQQADVESRLDRLAFLSTRRGAVSERVVYAAELIWRLADLLGASFPPSEPTVDDGPLRSEVRQVLDLLRNEFAAPWTMAELARAVSLSESALRRAFSAAVGMTPREFLHRVRLAHLEELLGTTTTTIADATTRVGWTSTAYARRLFARNHGMSPREYRAEVRAGLGVHAPSSASDSKDDRYTGWPPDRGL